MKKNEYIANGGFGYVYKGMWLYTPVALKYYNNIDKKSDVELVMKEFTVLKLLNHPRINQFYGISFDIN